MLRERVQTEALRTYLFAYGLHYASVSQDQLAASFQLPDKKVRSCPLSGSCDRSQPLPVSCCMSALFRGVSTPVTSICSRGS